MDGQELAERAARAYQAGIGPRFDDVLVDQGEDLSALQWSLLRLLVRRDDHDGEVLLLTDPTQRMAAPSTWLEPSSAETVGLLVSWTLSCGDTPPARGPGSGRRGVRPPPPDRRRHRTRTTTS